MDPVVQQLTQLVQQMLQVLQSAGGAGDDMGADPSMMGGDDMGGGAMPPDPSMMDDGGDMDGDMPDAEDGTMDKGMGGGYGKRMMKMDDSDMGGMGDMSMGGVTLHDRLSRVEQHVGLKKSASAAPLVDRVAQLEEAYLGEEYEGPMVARVEQLEKKILGKAATTTQPAKQPTTADEAPDVIPLDTLIKSAIAEGVRLARQEDARQSRRAVQEDDDLPEVQTMRKQAGRSRQVQFNNRRGQTHRVQGGGDELTKAAAAFGYDEDENLDEPVGLADMLLLQYSALKGGIPMDDDE